MSRIEAWWIHLSVAVVGLTGIVWAWMIYFLEPIEEFSILHHPWEPQMQLLHILGAPFLVFVLGLVWKKHVWGKIRQGHRSRRRTGLFLALLAAPAALSGWFLQVSVEEFWRQFWAISHLITGLIWFLGFLIHQVVPVNKES